METNEKLNPGSEEQANIEKSFAEQDATDNASIDFSDEEALLASNSEEFNLGDETDSESESTLFNNYSEMSKSQLVTEFKKLLDEKPIELIRKDVEMIKDSFYKIHRLELDTLRNAHENDGSEAPFVAPNDAAEQELKILFTQYRAKREHYLSKLENGKEENYKLKLQIIEDIKNLIGEEENLTQTFRKFHDLQARWREIGQVPQAYIKSLWDNYHHNVENFYDYVKINKELRDLDLKKNLEAKEELCQQAEALLENESIIEAFRQLQKYHEQWREIGPVPHEQRESIWARFKDTTSKINKKHQEYFESKKEEHQKNLEDKIALCEKAETISEYTGNAPKDWLQHSQELVNLMQAWKEVGFVPRKESNLVYERFKTARDKFFANRREFYKSFKQAIQTNLHLKKELCEKAEAIMNSEDWKQTTDELIALQRKWKEVGAVPRKYSDELWKRFRSACDVFFNRKSAHFSEVDSQYEDNLKAKEALIVEIEGFVPTDDSATNFELLKAFQQRWNQIGYVPLKEKEKIHKKYQEAIDKQFKLLKISDSDKKVMKYRNKIEGIQNSQNNNKADRVLRNERDKMYNKILQLESDIAVWENNMGFFAKSKNADSMIADVKHKIEQAREEIKLLEEKIKLIDSQYE